jgi:hypothetical protein
MKSNGALANPSSPCGDTMELKLAIKTALVLLLISCFASSPVKADGELAGGDLYSYCVSTDQVASTACRFYVLGIVQGVGLGDGAYLDATQHLKEKKKTIFCLPDNTPQAQMVAIVKESMKLVFAAHPDDKKLPAATTILGVMVLKFPCQK